LQNYSPALNQPFFIGDGLTGAGFGSVQTFHVLDDATRLYLGFADAFFFQGLPGWYDDNTGSFTAVFTVAPRGAVPEPSSLVLALLGLVVWAALYSRRLQLAKKKSAGKESQLADPAARHAAGWTAENLCPASLQ
jgi:hypothetical protein